LREDKFTLLSEVQMHFARLIDLNNKETLYLKCDCDTVRTFAR
jgi:hypothetical protein